MRAFAKDEYIGGYARACNRRPINYTVARTLPTLHFPHRIPQSSNTCLQCVLQPVPSGHHKRRCFALPALHFPHPIRTCTTPASMLTTPLSVCCGYVLLFADQTYTPVPMRMLAQLDIIKTRLQVQTATDATKRGIISVRHRRAFCRLSQ